MGVDFIAGKKNFQKGWDREEALLNCSDLFRVQPTSKARQIEGELREQASAEVAEELIIRRLEDGSVVACRMNQVIADFPNPPSDIVTALEASNGVACGTIENVGLFGGTIRVSLR